MYMCLSVICKVSVYTLEWQIIIYFVLNSKMILKVKFTRQVAETARPGGSAKTEN